MRGSENRLPLKESRGGIMPKTFPVKDQQLTATVKFAGIRKILPLRFLPYYSNFSKPMLRITMYFNDPKGRYTVGKVEIKGPRGVEWSEENVEWEQQYRVTLDTITDAGVHEYYLAASLMDNTRPDIISPFYREGRILNTGNVQSSENWVTYVIVAIIITLLNQLPRLF